jgi:hypothetical protein
MLGDKQRASAMYTIVFYRDDGMEIGSSPWADDLDSAKKHAIDSLKITKAARVAILDKEGIVLFTKDANI